MKILEKFKLSNINDKLIKASIFGAKILVFWNLFNLLVPIFQIALTPEGRALVRQSDQNALAGLLVNVLSTIVLYGVQALVYYGYSQIATWIMKLKNPEIDTTKKDAVIVDSEKNNKKKKY
ncbi:MAG: hypothetical protein WCK31_01165 [bacterium]